MASFKDKVVIITGSSSGIGATTAIEFARAGASVVLVARSKDRLQKTAEKCKKTGAKEEKILITPADLTDEAQVKQCVEETVSKFGKIDVLVNNVGQFVPSSLLDSPVSELDTVMKVNVYTTYAMSHYCMPHLIKTKGNIVNNSSVVSTRQFPRVITYSMAKAAVNHFTRCAAMEYAAQGVRVNCVCPGTIKTEGLFASDFFSDPTTRQQVLEAYGKMHPLGRVGESDEVAASILFLASQQASFITGCCLPVDGGFTLGNAPDDKKD